MTNTESLVPEMILTVREMQILRLLEVGMSNRDIADKLCISVHTTKNHVHNVLDKLGVNSRHEAAKMFRDGQYIADDVPFDADTRIKEIILVKLSKLQRDVDALAKKLAESL